LRIVVTGASGVIGRYVEADLLDHGHAVHALDRVPAPAGLAGNGATWIAGDVRDPALMARVMEDARAEGLIHLAALPTPKHGTPLEVFATNVEATFVALEAAGNAGVPRASIASSISLLGLPWGAPGLAPLYAPVDEATAAMMHRRHGMQIVALRISNTQPMAAHLERMAKAAEDPGPLAKELWAYLDVHDAARALALGVERDIPGFHVINVMAPDTYSALPSAELMARYHPTAPIRRPLVGREVPFDLTRSRELLGFTALHLLPLPR
jgi:nucleoside-diphosphate-sugar epimerase